MFASGVLKDGEWLPVDNFARDGKYTLAYTYRSPRCASKYQMGSRGVLKDGKHVSEPIYAEPSKEQQAGRVLRGAGSGAGQPHGPAAEAGGLHGPRMGRLHRFHGREICQRRSQAGMGQPAAGFLSAIPHPPPGLAAGHVEEADHLFLHRAAQPGNRRESEVYRGSAGGLVAGMRFAHRRWHGRRADGAAGGGTARQDVQQASLVGMAGDVVPVNNNTESAKWGRCRISCCRSMPGFRTRGCPMPPASR